MSKFDERFLMKCEQKRDKLIYNQGKFLMPKIFNFKEDSFQRNQFKKFNSNSIRKETNPVFCCAISKRGGIL